MRPSVPTSSDGTRRFALIGRTETPGFGVWVCRAPRPRAPLPSVVGRTARRAVGSDDPRAAWSRVGALGGMVARWRARRHGRALARSAAWSRVGALGGMVARWRARRHGRALARSAAWSRVGALGGMVARWRARRHGRALARSAADEDTSGSVARVYFDTGPASVGTLDPKVREGRPPTVRGHFAPRRRHGGRLSRRTGWDGA